MKIDHIAIWVQDLEKVRTFYSTYFGASCNHMYHNEKKNYKSYFLSFDGGCRIEIMTRPDIAGTAQDYDRQQFGLAHFSLAVGSKEMVNALTERLRTDGFRIASEPRTTGDGYYESVVVDPEGNIVEIAE